MLRTTVVLAISLSVIVMADKDIMTICEQGGEFGPSTGGLCAVGAINVLNGMCCRENKIREVQCSDKTDQNGQSLCPLTRIGCLRNLLGSLKQEIDFCAKTCQFCPIPSFD
ncbi:Protein CBG24413 [Caenorhabditis briggsae]|uniref:Protein CBG24413 n=1 Tax=Caenorhabditis briggsae TaxID=6238 RepID=A8WKN4_CAEBR|nr:Protein CBG24413 [Caenorhabditis briggsae]CAP21029.1 Protein CBG24413 [Caenorhabditis briggsae]